MGLWFTYYQAKSFMFYSGEIAFSALDLAESDPTKK